MLIVLIAGCQAADDRSAAASFPQLPEIRSRVTPVESKLNEREQDAADRAVAMIQRVELPLSTVLDESWSKVNERVIGPRARRVWQANGLRMAVMSMNEVDAFFEPLPHVSVVGSSRLVGGAHPSPIRTSSRLRGDVTVKLPRVGWGGEVDVSVLDEVEVTGGRLRLLIEMRPNGVGGVTVTLLPHHQVRESSLVPRDPLEKDLDGRVFDELAIAFDLNRDDVLVIGLAWPEAAGGESESEGADAGEGEDEDEREDEDAADEAVGSDERSPAAHVGRALLMGRHSGGGVQSVLLLRVESGGGAGR